jgi:hypothetical protein
MALFPWLLVLVGGKRSQRPGPSPTLGSLGPSHHRARSLGCHSGVPFVPMVFRASLVEKCTTTSMICIGQQTHLPTFQPWYIHDLVWYYNTMFKYSARSTNMNCLGTTKPFFCFSHSVAFVLGCHPCWELDLRFIFCVGMMVQTSFVFCVKTYLNSKPF